MKPIYAIIKRPIVTEKAMALQEKQNTYCFEVDLSANKIEIKAAVEEMFGVKVLDVRTLVNHGKVKRAGRATGKRSNWKKAFVRLEGEGKLDLLAPVQS